MQLTERNGRSLEGPKFSHIYLDGWVLELEEGCHYVIQTGGSVQRKSA